ncbi:hypothetical protein ES708_32799 [subsurface metagenome]
MSHSPSPQRRKIVTTGALEPRPFGFAMTPTYDDGKLIGITVQDPEGTIIRQRAVIVEEVNNRYPEASITALENSKISYSDYYAYVELPE